MGELADPGRLSRRLEDLERAWSNRGFRLSQVLLGGLTVAEVQDWLGLVGLPPSVEALGWWTWHGDYDASRGWRYPIPPTGLGFLSLPEAIDIYQTVVELYSDLPGLRALFPVAAIDRYQLWMHLDVPQGEASPLRQFHLDDASGLDFVVAPSLTWLIERWLRVLESGLCTTDDGWRPVVEPRKVKDRLGFDASAWFGDPVLSPLRHDPPPMGVG